MKKWQFATILILCAVILLTIISNRRNSIITHFRVSSDADSLIAPTLKADTLHIISQGIDQTYGTVVFGFSPGRNASITGPVDPPNSAVVFIVRDLTGADADLGKTTGLKAGRAFRRIDPGADKPYIFEFICDVDLTLSDKDLCALFGVDYE